MNLNEINRQGAQSYFTNKGVYKNPHPPGSAEYNEFERGWMQSLKKDDGRLVNSGPTYSGASARKSSYPHDDVELQAERYRSRKG